MLNKCHLHMFFLIIMELIIFYHCLDKGTKDQRIAHFAVYCRVRCRDLFKAHGRNYSHFNYLKTFYHIQEENLNSELVFLCHLSNIS